MSSRANRISYKGTVSSRSEAVGLIHAKGEYVIVERDRPRLMILRCPCGCGDDLVINLDSKAGPAWRYYKKRSGVSLYPSYWRNSDCRSHFIVWNNKISWCYGHDDDETDDYWSTGQEIESIIIQALRTDEFKHYIDLADECSLVPWECLQGCRQLEKKGKCLSGSGPLKWHFILSSI
jgi:hypothetical protein